MTEPDNAELIESGIAVLSEDEPSWDDGPFRVQGVALPEGSLTSHNSEGMDVYWTSDAVQRVAEAMQDRDVKITDGSEHDPETVLENPQPSPESIEGEVDGIRYKPGVGVLYEGEVDDPELAKRIERGRVTVSPTIFRTLGEQHSDTGGRVPDDIVGVRDLSIVAHGENDDASIEPAPKAATAMAAEVCQQAFTDTDGDGEEVGADAMTVSEPSMEGWSTDPWSQPSLDETFGGSMEAARESASWIGGDGEEFGDLSLFLLNGDGELNVNALDSAWRLAPQTEGVSDSDVDRLREMYEGFAVDAAEAGAISEAEFDDVWMDRADADTAGMESAREGDDGTASPSTSDGTTTEIDTMTDDTNDITNDERALLDAVEDPGDAVEVLRTYRDHEDPVIVEQERVETMESRVSTLEELMEERLVEDYELKPSAVDAMGFDAMAAQFTDDEEEFDASTLVQNPEAESAETGDGGDSTPSLDDADAEVLEELDVDDRDEAVEVLQDRVDRFEEKGWTSNAERAREGLDALGVEA